MIALHRPEVKNAIGKVFISELSEIIQSIRHDSSVRVVLMKSLVDKVFCAGADLKVISSSLMA